MEENSDNDERIDDYKPGDEVVLVILTEEDLQRGESYGNNVQKN